MRKLLIVLMLLPFFCAQAQRNGPRALRYHLNAVLNDSTHRLDGQSTLVYSNQTADTVYYIWFHCWPNAYRNDKTDFSDQALQNGHTRFYFSQPAARGYMNQLEFRVGGNIAFTDDHPVYQDVIKVILPSPLAPGDTVSLNARFHVQLPENVAGTGYSGRHFEVSNWYPEAAVCDEHGWHPMPFLEQGTGYHEAADFDVTLTTPSGYVIASGSADAVIAPGNTIKTQTFHARLEKANGFAWAADRRFRVRRDDNFSLPSGKKIQLAVYFLRADSVFMNGQLDSARNWLLRFSRFLPDYPYHALTIVESRKSGEEVFSGICFIDPALKGYAGGGQLPRQLAAQWFGASAAMDGREQPWLQQGLTEQAVRRAGETQPLALKHPLAWPLGPAPARYNNPLAWLASAEKEGTVQPLFTPADSLSYDNYILVTLTRSGYWLDALRQYIGSANYDRAIGAWLAGNSFRKDDASFRATLEKISGRDLSPFFLHPDPPVAGKDPVLPFYRPLPWLPLGRANGYTYPLLPAAGYNRYDGFQVGLLLHNYQWPAHRFQYVLAPLYATETRTVNGMGRLSLFWVPAQGIRKITLGVSGSRFSTNRSTDTTGSPLAESVRKIVPFLRFDLKNPSGRSTLDKQILLKSYLITENSFTGYRNSPVDGLFHPNAVNAAFRYLNEASMEWTEHRVLYPYSARIAFQQAAAFYRVNLTAQYFLNYSSGGGLSLRFFAAKFGVWNQHETRDLLRFEPKLLGVTGTEDYTYDNYFPGRSASYAFDKGPVYNGGLPAQQIYNRDGGLKLRLDPYDYVQGRSADWVTSLNFSSTLPARLFPFRMPVRIFFDVGTYSEAWDPQPNTSRFLYDGGVQISVFHDVLNIYAPIIYSSDFRSLLKQEGFGKRITFSIDMQAAARWLNKEGSYHADDH